MWIAGCYVIFESYACTRWHVACGITLMFIHPDLFCSIRIVAHYRWIANIKLDNTWEMEAVVHRSGRHLTTNNVKWIVPLRDWQRNLATNTLISELPIDSLVWSWQTRSLSGYIVQEGPTMSTLWSGLICLTNPAGYIDPRGGPPIWARRRSRTWNINQCWTHFFTSTQLTFWSLI